jgi:hypothetical protein
MKNKQCDRQLRLVTVAQVERIKNVKQPVSVAQQFEALGKRRTSASPTLRIMAPRPPQSPSAPLSSVL